MKLKIKRAVPLQAEFLSDLAFRSKAHWGYSADFMAQCKAELTYSADDIETSLCYFLEKQHQLVGFYILKSIEQSNCELEGLFLEPRLIGYGHGRELMNHAKNIAKKFGFKKMLIQSDPNSLKFYLAMGAVQVGTKPSLSIPGRDLPTLEILI